jgi:anti-sigma regulatory factor (Ser/Thr protein kinase)
MAMNDGASGRAEFAAEAAAVSQARQRLRQVLEALGVNADRQRAALLLLSEVVTNAVKHGGPADEDITLAWTLDRDMLKVAVVASASAAGGGPVVRQPNSEREDGRGMLIVDEIAECWDHRAVGGRRQVSFRVRV